MSLHGGRLVDLLPRPRFVLALCWHCWNLNSAVLDALTHALKSAMNTALLPPLHESKPVGSKTVRLAIK
ncbi:hypothetical protein BLL52_1078 [Rhodoferax antarcticus ANT.BR]|uniref:Uncharacterized protein n=1 Tax=Rhodoferax antarcticus ANT.BR TaxID=1111071 RepID=A0A1Q8YJA2_9BURK|nr:hypothetical protein BLL52_1078 [Rhodoferax antarcticus ANT.BR]